MCGFALVAVGIAGMFGALGPFPIPLAVCVWAIAGFGIGPRLRADLGDRARPRRAGAGGHLVSASVQLSDVLGVALGTGFGGAPASPSASPATGRPAPPSRSPSPPPWSSPSSASPPPAASPQRSRLTGPDPKLARPGAHGAPNRANFGLAGTFRGRDADWGWHADRVRAAPPGPWGSDSADGRVRQPADRPRALGHLLRPRGPAARVHVDAAAGRRAVRCPRASPTNWTSSASTTSASGTWSTASPSARRRVFYATAREAGQPGRPGPCRSTSSWPTAAGPPTGSRRPPATDQWWCSAGSTATPSTHSDRPKRHRILCTGDQVRAWKGTATVEEAGRMLGVAGRGSLGEGPEAGGPGAGVRGGRGVRRGQLVRGVRAAGARGDGLRCPARHHRQRWQPRVRARRRDRAGRPAEGCLGAGRRAAPRAGRPGPGAADCRRTRSSSSPASSTGTTAPTTSPTVLDGVVADPSPAPIGRRPQPHPNPELSIVTLQWNGMAHTRRMVESVPSEHRRALRADHRGQRLGMGGGQLRRAARLTG